MKDLNFKSPDMKTQNRQSGAILVTSLLLLVILTLLGVSSMTTSNFELIMATNKQAQIVSLANAEIAAGEGEVQVRSSYLPGPITNYIDPSAASSLAFGVYQYDSSTQTTAGFTGPTSFDWDGDGTNGFFTGPSGNKFVVEYMGGWTTTGASLAAGVNIGTNSRYIYRLSGQGMSARGGERLVQTLYATE